MEFLESTPHSMDSIWIIPGRVKYSILEPLGRLGSFGVTEHRKPISFRFPHHVYEHAHRLLQVQCSPLSAFTHQTNSHGHRSKANDKSFTRSSKNISHNGPRSAQFDCWLQSLAGQPMILISSTGWVKVTRFLYLC